MPRLHMFVEGTTEQVFAAKVLARHLSDFDVYLQKPVLVGHARKKGRIHRGVEGVSAQCRTTLTVA